MRAILFPVKYENEIKRYSIVYNLPPEIVASVINVESGYNKNAKSRVGALGLMQLLPSTASYITNLKGIDYSNSTQLLNAEINIKIGCAYLEYLVDKFKNVYTALASYNAGETVVKSWLQDSKYSSDLTTLSFIPYKETKLYIKKIKNNIKIYSQYNIYK